LKQEGVLLSWLRLVADLRQRLLGRNRDVTVVTDATSLTADGFAVFFVLKNRVRPFRHSDIPPPPIIVQGRRSRPSDLVPIVRSSPIKSCSLDSVPTFILREFIDVLRHLDSERVSSAGLAARLTETRNCHATFKKPCLDTADINNYRPVSQSILHVEAK